jgi:alkane 1-monooxygenase
LRDYQESPVLPTGYAGMIVLAIVPAFWRRVMDPRVLAHFGGDLSLANISPRTREKLLARYGTPPSSAPQEPPVETTGAGHGVVSTSSTDAIDDALAWRCPGCDYVYDVVAGEEREGFAAGTAWSEIPTTWCCPDCGVREKIDFVAVEPVATG